MAQPRAALYGTCALMRPLEERAEPLRDCIRRGDVRENDREPPLAVNRKSLCRVIDQAVRFATFERHRLIVDSEVVGNTAKRAVVAGDDDENCIEQAETLPGVIGR